MKRQKQLSFFKSFKKEYGGDLLKTRKGRQHGRPLSTTDTMHLVLKSKNAIGDWSFRQANNEKRIKNILAKFSIKYGVRIVSLANVGNHLHLQIKLSNRFTYRPFIRAITSAIAMAITGVSRWNRVAGKFWSQRPFTRVIQGWKGFLTLRNYIQINQVESKFYVNKTVARLIWRATNSTQWLGRPQRPAP